MGESIFEIGVVIRAIDYFTGPLQKMTASAMAAQGKMKAISDSMALMGKGAAEIDAVTASLNRMKDVQAFQSLSRDLESIGMARDEIAQMESSYMRMAAAQRDMASAQTRYAAGRDMVSSGVGALTTGAAGAFGIYELVKSAGEFQSTMTVIKDLTGATAEQMKGLSTAVQDASTKVSKFTDYQTGAFAQQLASSGFSTSQIEKLLVPVAQFAEVQAYEKKSTSPTESVSQAIQMSHAFGLYDPNQLTSFLNTFNKYSVMQPDNSTQLYQTLQYLNSTAKGLGMSQSDELAMAAIDNRIGLTGSHGGTNSADFLLRLIPGLVGGAPGKKGTPAAWAAMEKLGFVDKNGNSPFFTKQGKLISLNGLLGTMIGDSKKYNPEQLTQLYKAIFGIYGGNAAKLLANPKSLEQLQKMQGQLHTVKDVGQINNDLLKTPEGQMNLFKSNSVILMQRLGMQLATALNPALQKANSLLNRMLDFSKAHPAIVHLIGDFTLWMVGGKLLEGSLKIIGGNLRMLKSTFDMLNIARHVREMTTFGKVLTNVGKLFGLAKMQAMLFRDGLRITNSLGQLTMVGKIVAGVRMSLATLATRGLAALKFLGSGVVTALRLFGQFQFMAVKAGIAVMNTFAKGLMAGAKYLISFGATILRTGLLIGRWAIGVAADWLVAMGPVGWIIMGVTAVIVAGIAMWKTNFLGFRDGLKAVWKFIQTEAGIAWKNIVKFGQDAIKWFQDLPNNMHKIGQDLMRGLVNGVQSMLGSVTGVISGVANGVVKTFKGLLGIHSPSKVFADHGKYIVQGLQQGIEGNAYLVNRSMQGLANGVVGSFRPSNGNAGTFRPSQMSGGIPLNNGGQTVIVQSGAIVIQGGNYNPQELAHMVITELGRTSRKTFMSSGSSMNMGAI